jgi:hypothetical protein
LNYCASKSSYAKLIGPRLWLGADIFPVDDPDGQLNAFDCSSHDTRCTLTIWKKAAEQRLSQPFWQIGSKLSQCASLTVRRSDA